MSGRHVWNTKAKSAIIVITMTTSGQTRSPLYHVSCDRGRLHSSEQNVQIWDWGFLQVMTGCSSQTWRHVKVAAAAKRAAAAVHLMSNSQEKKMEKTHRRLVKKKELKRKRGMKRKTKRDKTWKKLQKRKRKEKVEKENIADEDKWKSSEKNTKRKEGDEGGK